MNPSKRILILCNYPLGVAPSQRFRFEQYLDHLRSSGFQLTIESFFDSAGYHVLYKPGHTLRKALSVLSGFCRRIAMLRRARRFDYVFIALEATPVGPPVIEWALFQLGCRIVYDIDDVIFMSRTSEVNRLVARFRWRSKVAYIARHSHRVTGCNKFLRDWAAQHNPQAIVLPTTIDSTYYCPPDHRPARRRPVIGWTGSRSNLPYLDLVTPALRRLQESYDFEFRVICDQPPKPLGIRHYQYVKWNAETEVEDLAHLDIGLMPVPDDLWAKGKVGLKAIQYSALEIVPVASDSGSGPEVVLNGVTGLLVKNTDDEWTDALRWMLEHPERWAEMGRAAKAHILATYSVSAQAENYVRLFQ